MSELPLERAYYWENARPHAVFLTQPLNGVARDWTWKQTMDEARRVANYLIAKQYPRGSHIVIFSKNCAWWIMAELAIWMAGHTTVPVYSSLTAKSARQLFEHCDPVICFLGAIDSTELASHSIPETVETIRFPTAPPIAGTDWEEIVKTTSALTQNPQRGAEEIATIIYSSGTTGISKGAMHHFAAFPFLASAVAQVVGETSHRAVSYLPLAHIAERALTETSAIYFGWHLFFNENLTTFLTDLKRAQPTVFFSVPRLYTKFQQRVFEKISSATLDRMLRVPLLKTAIGQYIRHGMGLGEVVFAASGSAPLPLDLLHWYLSIGLPLTEGYGTTEAGITFTAPHCESRPGWVGKSTPGVEAKISEIGEVLVRSPMNMLGYYKNPEETRLATTDDGFIRTGDLGELSSDGWLKITGRLSDQFKTGKGKFVFPTKLEALIVANPAVDHCLVLGKNMATPCAVVVLTLEAQKQAATESGRQELEQSFAQLLTSVNAQVEHHERLAFIALVNTHWTIENGFMTPTLKLKRTPLELFYRDLLPMWAESSRHVIWHLTA